MSRQMLSLLGVVLSSAISASSAAGVHRCQIDGTVTYGDSPCLTDSALETAPAPAAAIKEVPPACRASTVFAANVAEARRAGLSRDAMVESTQRVNPQYVPIVDDVFSVAAGAMDTAIAALYNRCRLGQ